MTMKKVLLSAIVIATVVLTGCNSGGGEPKVVLGQFFDALTKKDMATARMLSTADSKTMLDLMEMGMKTETKETEKYDKANMEFGEAKIDGDKATVPVKEKTSGETMNYTLKKEGGSWKVAFDKASIMSMGMDKMNEKGINVTDSLDNIMDELKKVDMDSLQRGMKEGAKALDSAAKLLEGLKK
jgi:outer membrane murein-binding lipoprotein Lpp